MHGNIPYARFDYFDFWADLVVDILLLMISIE